MGGSGSTLSGLQDCVDSEAVLDWFAEKVASNASAFLERASDAVDGSKEYKVSCSFVD